MIIDFIRALPIVIKASICVLHYSFLGLYEHFRKRFHRPRADYLIRGCARDLLRVFQLNYEVVESEPLYLEPGKPYIVMCNHSSIVDIPVLGDGLMGRIGSIRFLAKKELFRVPFFGPAMQAAGILSIDRSNHIQAMKDLDHARKQMEDGIAVIAFPEGKRSTDGKLLPFKKGVFVLAIQTGATIVPAYIRGSSQVLPARSFKICLNSHVTLALGKPVDASQFSLQERDHLMETVRNQMETLQKPDEFSPSSTLQANINPT